MHHHDREYRQRRLEDHLRLQQLRVDEREVERIICQLVSSGKPIPISLDRKHDRIRNEIYRLEFIPSRRSAVDPIFDRL